MDLTCSQKSNTLELYDKRSGIPLCPKKLHCMDKGDVSGLKMKYRKASCFCNDEMKSRSKQWKKNEMAKQLSIEAFKVTLNMIPHPSLDYYWNCSASVFVAIALFLTCAHFSICLNVPAKICKICHFDRRNGQVISNEPIYQELNLNCDTTDSRPLDFYRNIKSVIAEPSDDLEQNNI
ncbi:Hypothetical predicted protein [Cloeon dipterum]|nr:Hypothetical predicted protein [Cloeon dipterum]CAB3381729.1 Hypothetical predicted protein [Cloeon dipterum]